MGSGIVLAVLGAILTFAVRAQPSFIDLRVVGVILMLAAAVMIWNAVRGPDAEKRAGGPGKPSEPRDPRSPIRGNPTMRDTLHDRDHE